MAGVKKTLLIVFQTYTKLPVAHKILFWLSVLTGSLIRFVNLFNSGFYFDLVYTQYAWGKAALELGSVFHFWKFYPMRLHYDYPPLSLIYEYILAYTSSFFGLNKKVFIIQLKLVNWLVDIALIGFLISLARKYASFSTKHLYLLACFVYLTPSIWFISATWGQNDTLVSLISILALYILATKKNLTNSSLASLKLTRDSNFWSGVILSIGFWIKQQPLLFAPIFVLYYLRSKTWSDLLRASFWAIGAGLVFIVLDLLYTAQGAVYYPNPLARINMIRPWLEKMNFSPFNNWQLMTNIFVLAVLASFFVLWFKRKKVGNWLPFRRFMLGFLSVSILIILPFSLSNSNRLGRVIFATIARSDSVSIGAANFLTLAGFNDKASDPVFSLGNLTISVSLFGLILGSCLFLVALNKIYNWTDRIKQKSDNFKIIFNKSLNLESLLLLSWTFSTIYFMFFTKMHSRYLHLSIIFALFVLVFMQGKKYFASWVTWICVLNLGYLLNQISTFYSVHKTIAWVNIILENIQMDVSKLSSLLSFIAFLFLYRIVLQRLSEIYALE